LSPSARHDSFYLRTLSFLREDLARGIFESRHVRLSKHLCQSSTAKLVYRDTNHVAQRSVRFDHSASTREQRSSEGQIREQRLETSGKRAASRDHPGSARRPHSTPLSNHSRAFDRTWRVDDAVVAFFAALL
jgi:hypothetical protein